MAELKIIETVKFTKALQVLKYDICLITMSEILFSFKHKQIIDKNWKKTISW